MNNEVTILIAEDDEGNAFLIESILKQAGVKNKIIHFWDGEETLDFLLCKNEKSHRKNNAAYLLLLDIRMPRIDGVAVLKKIKEDKHLRRMPVIMITTTDDPREIQNCHNIGCSTYITKPVNYEKFNEAINRLGLFLKVVDVPELSGVDQYETGS